MTECISVKFSEGLGIFDNHYGYPEIDDKEIYDGSTGKVVDIQGPQAHAGRDFFVPEGREFKIAIDQCPYLHVVIKAEKDTNTCLFLMVNDKKPNEHISRFIVIGKTLKGYPGKIYDVIKDCFDIEDDGKWHEYDYDLRRIREEGYPNADRIHIIQFYSWTGSGTHTFHFNCLSLNKEPSKPISGVRLIDEFGEERSDFDIGESLTVQIAGLKPETVHDLVLLDEHGEQLFTSSLMSNISGMIEPTVLWPQFGLEDPHIGMQLTVEQAMERWQGHKLKLEVRREGKTLLKHTVQFADSFTRPLLLSTNEEGMLVNGFEAGDRDAVISGYNIPFQGHVRVFMVPRQYDWHVGDRFMPVQLASGRPAYVDVEVSEERRLRARVSHARELISGAYDFIIRQLRYGYEDDEDLVLRSTDIATRRSTGLVVREKFMASKAVLGGCANMLPISGRPIAGAPYFQHADTFQVGENIYGALDPAALDPNLQGKMVALYVIQHKAPATWVTDKSLVHLAQLGGNSKVQKFKTQAGCINFNKRLLWQNATDVGEYDVVADFGNNKPNSSTFVSDASFDQPLDIIDGYFVAGFRVVPDPTTDTTFTYYGGFEYDESTQGSKTVTNDYGSSVTVPLRAVVRFPADVAGTTTPGQISAALVSYPMVVIVHGQGHDYKGYDYLLNHWAMNGFIAASIHLVNTSGVMKGSDRALILFEHLNILKNIFGAKAANNIGIMGHSRGGEAVAIAPRLNNQQGLGHNINAVISLAPTNQYTNETLGGAWATPYLVIYGAMDGDVDGSGWQPWHFTLGNSGFALYDKANNAKKCMVFVYGATHNRFTTIGTETDVASLGPTDKPKLINVDAHQKIARAYMTAFFRWQLKNEDQWQGIFRGEWVPAAVTQADGGKVKLYVQYSDTSKNVIDNFEGIHTSTSWQVSTNGGSVDDSGTLPVDPVEDELYDADAHSPHETSGLVLRWDGTGGKLEFKPKNPIDIHNFKAISFRVTQKVDSKSNPVDQAQDLYLTLTDTKNKSRAIKVGKFAEIPSPQKRYDNNLTKSAMCTVQIPLHVFTIEVIGTDKVNLNNIKALTFEFKAKPKGEIEIDDIEFTN